MPGTTDQRQDAAAAIRGDADAMRRVWEANRRWVAGVLLAFKSRDADLEDLLQDVAMAFVRKVGEVREPEAIRPWLRAIAVNAARLDARRARSRPDRQPGTLRLAGAEPREHRAEPPERLFEDAHREEAQRVLRMAMDLPEAYREPVVLRCVRGMSYREISEVTGLAETTIETRIARGRRMLRERIHEAHSRRTNADVPKGMPLDQPGRPLRRLDDDDRTGP